MRRSRDIRLVPDYLGQVCSYAKVESILDLLGNDGVSPMNTKFQHRIYFLFWRLFCRFKLMRLNDVSLLVWFHCMLWMFENCGHLNRAIR